MDFKLRVFKEVAENLSFTKAAKLLKVTQPAISKHISELESDFNLELFNRRGGRVEMTHSGELFYRHVKSILDNYSQLKSDMSFLSEFAIKEIRIGVCSTISSSVMPELFARFLIKFPNITIDIQSGSSDCIKILLSEGKIDLGIICDDSSTDFYSIPFIEDDFVLVTSASNEKVDVVYLSEKEALFNGVESNNSLFLRDINLVLPKDDSDILNLISQNLVREGMDLCDLNILLYLTKIEEVIKFLKSYSDSYAILPKISVREELNCGLFKSINLQGFSLRECYSFIYNQNVDSISVREFINYINRNNYPK